MNNTIVLLKVKVAAELHSHSPFDLLHVPIFLGSGQLLQALHFLHSENKYKYKIHKVEFHCRNTLVFRIDVQGLISKRTGW